MFRRAYLCQRAYSEAWRGGRVYSYDVYTYLEGGAVVFAAQANKKQKYSPHCETREGLSAYYVDHIEQGCDDTSSLPDGRGVLG